MLSTPPPPNAACPAIVRTIEHYLPSLHHDRATDQTAAVAVLDYLPAGRWLDRWVTEVGLSFHAESLGWDFDAQMHQGLTHIKRLCPSLPASAVSVPLPR